MLDRPPITDAAIAAALRDHYAIETTTLEFLALGHDANAWTFRGRGGSRDVFVKIRRAIDPARLATVRFLEVPDVCGAAESAHRHSRLVAGDGVAGRRRASGAHAGRGHAGHR